MKIKKIEAQNQVLKNFIKAKGLDKEIKNNSEKITHKNIDPKIYKDLKFTLLYIVVSFGILFLIKYLNLNLFFNKLI